MNKPENVFDMQWSAKDNLQQIEQLNLEQEKIQMENEALESLFLENSLALTQEMDNLKETRCEVYEMRDKFCDDIYKELMLIESNLGLNCAEESTIVYHEVQKKVDDDIEKCTDEIAKLRRLNATVDLELMVLKAELARAEDEKLKMNSNEQEKQNEIRQEIENIRIEISKLEMNSQKKDSKSRKQRESTSLTPPAKRKFIRTPVAPNNSPIKGVPISNTNLNRVIVIDEEVFATKGTGHFLNESDSAEHNLPGTNISNQKPVVANLERKKSKFVFKRASNYVQRF